MRQSCVYHPEITVRTAYDLKPCFKKEKFISRERQSCRHTLFRTYVNNYFGDPHFGVVESYRMLLLDVELWRGSASFPDTPALLQNSFCLLSI
jgi:hypothetical protein